MLRFLVLVLVLLVPFASAQTVGPSPSSQADFVPEPGQGPENAIKACLLRYGQAILLPGVYQFVEPLSGSFNGARITGPATAVLKSVGSGSVGLFDLTGDHILIDGIKLQVDTFVNSQAVVKLSGKYARITRCVMDVTTSSGNTTTPMNLIELNTCFEPEITENLIHPNKGVRVLKMTEGHGGTISRNRVRNATNEGIGGAAELPAEDTDYRLVYRVFEFQGAQWFSCEDNIIWNLGTTGAGNTVNRGIYYNKTTTIASSEEAHFSIRRNKIEAIAFEANAIMIAGAQWFSCDENQIGWAKGVPADLTDGGIWIGARITDDALTESTDAADASTQGTVRNNQIHNFAASHTPPVDLSNDSLAVGIYLSRCKKIQVHDNNLTLIFGFAGILANSTVNSDLSFQGNYIASNDITAEWGIAFFGTIGGNYRFSDNVALDMWTGGTSGVIQTTLTSATANVTGLTNPTTGAIYKTPTTGAITTITVTGTNTFHRSSGSFVTDGFQVGDIVTATGLATAGDVGKLLYVTTVTAGDLTTSGALLTDDGSAGETVTIFKVGGLTSSNLAQT